MRFQNLGAAEREGGVSTGITENEMGPIRDPLLRYLTCHILR